MITEQAIIHALAASWSQCRKQSEDIKLGFTAAAFEICRTIESDSPDQETRILIDWLRDQIGKDL